MTFRTTFRETRKSRQIALIVIFREKYARRILAIVSTISISISASQTTRRPVWTLIPGVPIGCRSPRKRGPYSTPRQSAPSRPSRPLQLIARLLSIQSPPAFLLDGGEDGFARGCGKEVRGSVERWGAGAS